ncbi:hypothetical protein CC80DRAFT_508345 [Byssothecium circinans]|uniref:Uncharacterized protein n=1 Tax=Byssothecium circinans TaxID=147558 RepID=A0A6A5THY7_9PLEO|nr:hypothetical protein CC80DRAFT_508345 [Byssothecium circinans]
MQPTSPPPRPSLESHAPSPQRDIYHIRKIHISLAVVSLTFSIATISLLAYYTARYHLGSMLMYSFIATIPTTLVAVLALATSKTDLQYNENRPVLLSLVHFPAVILCIVAALHLSLHENGAGAALRDGDGGGKGHEDGYMREVRVVPAYLLVEIINRKENRKERVGAKLLLTRACVLGLYTLTALFNRIEPAHPSTSNSLVILSASATYHYSALIQRACTEVRKGKHPTNYLKQESRVPRKLDVK